MPAYHGHRVVVHAVVPLRYQPVLPLAHDAQAGTQRSRPGFSHGQPRVAHRRPQVAEHLADVHEEQRRSVLCELGDYQARCVPVARGFEVLGVLKPLERAEELAFDRLGRHAAAHSGEVAEDASGCGQLVAVAAREGLLQQAGEALKGLAIRPVHEMVLEMVLRLVLRLSQRHGGAGGAARGERPPRGASYFYFYLCGGLSSGWLHCDAL